MQPPLDRTRRGRCSGITLLEVLIALLVLSIGLLGAARLQVVGSQSLNGSSVRGQAVLLAYDMGDRMRANAPGMLDGAGNPVGFYNSVDGVEYQIATDNGCTESGGVLAVDCTVAQMAAHDLFEWNATLAARLPAGVGTTCIDATPNDGTPAVPACDDAGGVYAVKVWWTEVEETGPATKRYVTRVNP